MSNPLTLAITMSLPPVFLMGILSIIAYLLSRVVNPKWLTFAKDEGMQVVWSILLIFIIVGGTQVVYQLVHDYTGQDPFEAALEYIKTVESDAFKGFYAFFLFKYALATLSAVVVPLDPFTEILGHIPVVNMFLDVSATRPFADLSTMNSATDYLLMVLIFPLFSSIIAQSVGLIIFQHTMFSLVLPVGLFLRIFPNTRNAGSLMIAVAIGFYVVFPTTYLLHNYAYSSIRETNLRLIQSGVDAAFENPFTSNPEKKIWDYFAFVVKNAMYVSFVKVMNWLSMLFFAGLMLPTLSIVITMTFIRTMQKIIIMNFD
ncbi:hypothetical protein J7K41_03465 [Candidatus Micrarchaeota archaeon]|nr:hypothetical protein [Candidatus Micrarchaeota archaeon]